MGRATLNFIDLCDIHEAYFEGEDVRGAKAIGFRDTKNGKLWVSMKGMFESPCKNHCQ